MSMIEYTVAEEFDCYSNSEAIVEQLRYDLYTRAKIGLAKYGVTLDRTDLSKADWFQHLKEELLDACNYATRLEMYEELSFEEKDVLDVLKRDLFHALEGIYENSMFE